MARISKQDDKRGYLRSALVNFSLLAITLLIMLAAAEGILRLFGMADPILNVNHPVYGYEPKPNQSPDRLGIPVFINDVGLRDNESRASLRQSGQRILVIGDSVTYGGSRTRQADLFTEVLERKLRAQGHLIKVLNAGVNGYSVSQMVNRARRLAKEIEPDYLVIYTIRNDFFRVPVKYLAEGNRGYPTTKPHSALSEFVFLSVNHINKRYPFKHFLPQWLERWWHNPDNLVPPYDKSKIVDIHLAAVEDFLRTAWEDTGRSRRHVLVFFSPLMSDLMARRPRANADLVARLDELNVQAYDLQRDFQALISGQQANLSDYYWDDAHFLEKGHALAADILYRYFVQEWFRER